MKENSPLSILSELGTASVSDALDSLGFSGGLKGLKPRGGGCRFAGPAFTVRYAPIENRDGIFRNAGNYIDGVAAGEVIVIDNGGRDDATSWGGILTACAKAKRVAGTVVHGSARDTESYGAIGYPVFSRHVFMQSGKNRAVKVAEQVPVSIGGVSVRPGDVICADADGCVVVPKELLAETAARAAAVARTEARIAQAVARGESLEAARGRYGYAEPWKERA